jgi:O-antigen/teichoic acid export membrane protein
METTRRRRSAHATLLGSGACTVVAAVQTLVLLPLYLSKIGPELYGIWMATGEVFVWLLAFDFGVPNLLIQRTGAFLADGDSRSIGSHFGTSLLVLGGIAAIVFSAVYVFAPTLAGSFGLSVAGAISLADALRVGALAMCLTLVGYGFVGLARGLQDTTSVQAAALAGTVLGFGTTAALLLADFGLLSIAYGLLVRGSLTLAGGIVWFFSTQGSVRGTVTVSRGALADIGRHCPPMFAAGMAYALMNNSMVTLAAVMFSPQAAVVLGVTRKIADFARGLLDMVGHAAYGGFSNLFAEGDRERVRSVYRELQSTFFVIAVALLAAYVAANSAIVASWVGAEMYGGFGMTVALAGAVGTGAWSYMQVSLYRSMGHHGRASSALLAECAARIAAMCGLALWLGPVGLAVGALVTATVSGVWASRMIAIEIKASPDSGLRVWAWRVLPFVVGGAIALSGVRDGWGYALAIAMLVGSASVVALLIADPALAHVRTTLRRRLLGGPA